MSSKPVTLIEALSRGFELVASRWHLFLIPLLLDILLLFGPQVDFRPVVSQVSHVVGPYMSLPGDVVLNDVLWEAIGGANIQHMPGVGAPSVVGANIQFLVLTQVDPQSWLAGSQALQVATPLFWADVRIPSLLIGRTAMEVPFAVTPPVIEVTTVLGVALLTAGTYTVGFALGVAYMTLIAVHITGQPIHDVISKLPGTITQLAGVVLIVTLINVIVGLPFWLLAGLVSLQNVSLGLLTLFLGYVFMGWCLLFTTFAGHGVLLHQRAPLAAIWDSVRVVQWYLPATSILMLLILVIDFTMTQIWLVFTAGWMLIPGFIGHAIISAALMAAMFVYYHDRHQHWAEERARLLNALRKQRAQ
jgi:hypothetical protein